MPLFLTCDACDTGFGPHRLEAHDDPSRGPAPFEDAGNASNLDLFYIYAASGIDFETGEVSDPARNVAAYRDDQRYGITLYAL